MIWLQPKIESQVNNLKLFIHIFILFIFSYFEIVLLPMSDYCFECVTKKRLLIWMNDHWLNQSNGGWLFDCVNIVKDDNM